MLQNIEAKKFFIGDGAELCYNTLGETIKQVELMPETQRMQRASGVALLAFEMAEQGLRPDGGAVCAQYLRLSQAERERLEAEKNKA